MSTNRFGADEAVILREALEAADSDLLVVNPSRSAVAALVAELGSIERPPTVRLLAAADPVKDVMEDFLVASNAADLIADGTLAIRLLGETPNSSLLVTETTVTSIVSGAEQVAGLTSDEPEFVGDVRDEYDGVWETADEYTLRTPPLSEVRETLAADIGEDVAAEFDAVLSTLEAVTGDELDEVTISVIVAARHAELLYDISKWGEDVGLASKATFSRTKTKLEDTGVIETEKVPIDVGRPRLRLTIADDRLREADPEDLGEIARQVLEE